MVIINVNLNSFSNVELFDIQGDKVFQLLMFQIYKFKLIYLVMVFTF